MSAPFPSRYELKVAGFSLVIAQLGWVISGIFSAAYDPEDTDVSVYEIETEEEVVELHEKLSSSKFRVVMEVYAAVYWLSFPILLAAIYGIKKMLTSIFIGTKMEMWVYVAEKAYLLSLLVTNIIGPALGLVIVSYEWSIHVYTPEADYIPTGYYIQLYALTFLYEMYDAVCIADGLFLFLVCVVPLTDMFMTSEPKFRVLNDHGTFKKFGHGFFITVATTVAIVYMVALFRFAKDGFFSLAGGASFLVIYGIVIKFLYGIRLIKMVYTDEYDELNRVFGVKGNNDDAMINNDANSPYAMDKIDNKATNEDANL